MTESISQEPQWQQDEEGVWRFRQGKTLLAWLEPNTGRDMPRGWQITRIADGQEDHGYGAVDCKGVEQGKACIAEWWSYSVGFSRLRRLSEVVLTVMRSQEPKLPDTVLYEVFRQLCRDYEEGDDGGWSPRAE